MIAPATFKFLKALTENNNREWFHAHKAGYQAARENLAETVEQCINGIVRFDPGLALLEADECIFRIYKDVRFSKDKTPYKTHLGAFMTDQGRKVCRAGYYLHVEPGNCFIAGGLYRPPSPELNAIRNALADDAGSFRKIISKKNFKTTFGPELPGERLKTAPRGIAKDHPDIDLLRLKSFEIAHPVTQKDMGSQDFFDQAVTVFKTMKDYVAWLNTALTNASR